MAAEAKPKQPKQRLKNFRTELDELKVLVGTLTAVDNTGPVEEDGDDSVRQLEAVTPLSWSDAWPL